MMAIPTSRTKKKAQPRIESELCTGCGLCVAVCKDFGLKLSDEKAVVSATSLFGCFGCGHCMAICPTGAITVTGRTLSAADLTNLPTLDLSVSHTALRALLQKRRSIREFTEKAVSQNKIDTILQCAQTAPMGLPPSDVHVLVFDSKEKTQAFAENFCTYLEGMRWMGSRWFLTLMRPFWGKETDELFKGFLAPLLEGYTSNMVRGINLVTYDAPLAMYFYATPYADPADPIIAATYAMLAGESLGLGTCMIGGIHPFIQNGPRARQFRKTHGIRHKSKEGLFVIFGHPKVHYVKGIERSFAAVDIYDESAGK